MEGLDAEVKEKYFMYRPAIEGLYTFADLNTCVTLDQVLEANALLDMQAWYNKEATKQAGKPEDVTK